MIGKVSCWEPYQYLSQCSCIGGYRLEQRTVEEFLQREWPTWCMPWSSHTILNDGKPW